MTPITAIVFSGWLLLCGAIVFRSPFYRKAGLSPGWMVGFFLLKVGAGALYAWLFTRWPDYENRIDTWRYFVLSQAETDWLLRDPAGFFADLVTPRYADDSGLFGSRNSLLNDLKEVTVVKLAALCNLLSGRNYYVNLLFFNLIVLYGQVGIALIWSRFFRIRRPEWMVAAIVLWPSVLFWSSGFHRDGLMLHAMGWALWLSYRIFRQRRASLLQAAGWILHVGFLFVLRNYLAIVLVAGMLLALVYYYSNHRIRTITALLVIGVAGLLLLSYWAPSLSLPYMLARRQAEFLALEGGSRVSPLPLQEGWSGLLHSLPAALFRAFAAPLPWGGLKTMEWPVALENACWLLSLLPAARLVHTYFGTDKARMAWIICCLWVVVVIGLITGLTIPFVGAIARYKSLLWPLMVPPVLYWWYSLLAKRKPESLQGDRH
ncbi:MAG: glycosyltransferase family 39 protein [Chitinophagaceae bacterium]|jgi:hypothetical protein|nr:glycosyltransferase family 39 protein [Chitinophagaceae bacterium]